MKKNPPHPPKFPEWILSKISFWVDKHSLLDDLEQEFCKKRLDPRNKSAGLWYWFQAFRTIPSILLYALYRNLVMFKNYTTIALRNIRKHKIFSLINIMGLAIGISLCLFVISLIFFMYGSDRFHTKKDRIYRVISQTITEHAIHDRATAPLPLATELEQIPGIETVVRVKKNFGGATVYKEKGFLMHGLYAEKDFFHVFSYEMERGDPQTALVEPYSVVLTQEVAQKFFGDIDPTGEILHIQDLGDFTVTGVMKNVAKLNTHMKFESLASLSTLTSLENQKKIYASLTNWKNLNDNYVYFLLRENASPQRIEELLPGIAGKHYGDTEEEFRYYLQALTKISPGKNLGNNLSTMPIPTEAPLFLSLIALVIMVIACFNYTNLSLAKALSRAKEVGIRKTIGANRFKLITQFIGESITYALFALVVAIFLYKLLLPQFFQSILLHVDLENLGFTLVLSFILFSLFIGFVAGIVPAILISKFNPTEVLKDITKTKIFSRVNLRRALVVIQFFISFIFIITTFVLFKQIHFQKNIDLGFQTENILNVELQGTDYDIFRQEIANHPGISAVSASAFIPCTGMAWLERAKCSESAEYFAIDFMSIDRHYIPNLGLELVAGRNFPVTTDPNKEKFVILNELAVERFGFISPVDAIGQTVIFDEKNQLEVIGVVNNFLSRITQNQATPMVLRVVPEYFEYANLKIRTDDVEPILLFLETKWKELQPYRPFRFAFLEDQLEDYYTGTDNALQGISFVTFLAVLIAFFGLLGMVIYDTEARVKEIGIRKVMGASVWDIIKVTSKSFIFLLLLATTLAIPVAWFANYMLLQSIANHITLGFGIFAQGLLIMFALGFLIIFSQTIKAASGDPVDSLRYE
ncbi:MAG: ABC transporter permease [Candidatus Aminicenantes bacterium]|nr:MAG: ABC transporter permease [Candidatus Aminicenantes bacterium]